MDRRAFLGALGFVVVPLGAGAQPAGKVYRLGYLAITSTPARSSAPGFEALVAGLRELGYVEGKNLVIDERYAEGRPERYGELAAELVALRVDVIVTVGMPAVLAAKRATSTVPIIMAVSEDPVAAGLAASLTRPGGNVTGFTRDVGQEVMVKNLQLLKEAVPRASRVGVLFDPDSNTGIDRLEAGAAALSIALRPFGIRTGDDISRVFRAMSRDAPDALLVLGNNVAVAHRRLIVDLSAARRLPAMYWWRQPVVEGGLMGYGPDFMDSYRRAAVYVGKVLGGANPGDLPIQQPTKFELVINLKTAKALDLTISPALLLRADQVIE
jgi:putative tryptophan/tyrosine transport system substrate-binding protein